MVGRVLCCRACIEVWYGIEEEAYMTLHPATLRAVTKIAAEMGERLVKADCQSVIVGPVEVRFRAEIDWSWWWVLSPLWVPLGFAVLLLIIVCAIYLIVGKK